MNRGSCHCCHSFISSPFSCNRNQGSVIAILNLVENCVSIGLVGQECTGYAQLMERHNPKAGNVRSVKTHHSAQIYVRVHVANFTTSINK